MSSEREEELIRAVESSYDRAWGTGDTDALLQCLTQDAVLVNPRGEIARGRDDIRRLLGDFLKGYGEGSRHTSRLSHVHFVTEDVAVVDGEATVEDLALQGPSKERVTHRFTDILVRKHGHWRIAHVRAYF